MGCDLQWGECFGCSGNTSDWLRVKLAALGRRLGSRCGSPAPFNDSPLVAVVLSDTAGDDAGDGASWTGEEEAVVEVDDVDVSVRPAGKGVDGGTACG